MNDLQWKKDENPYLVFSCNKCKQFSYVKIDKLRRKCGRCNRINYLKNIIGEVVKGITAAKDLVIKKQNEIAYKEYGGKPTFQTNSSFIIRPKKSHPEISNSIKLNIKSEKNYEIEFEALLQKLLKNGYKKVPNYLFEMEMSGIPKEFLMPLMKSFSFKGVLKELKNNYFEIML